MHLFSLIKATAPPEVVDRIRKGGAVEGWDQLNTARFAPIIEKLVANKIYVNPTIASQFEKASKYLPEFDKINTNYVNGPMGQSAPKPVRDRYALSFKPGPAANAAVLAEGYKRAGQFVKQFADAGGKIVSGTDSDAGRIGTSGLTLHEEMMMLSEVGVPPMKVIQSSTGWAMEAWGKGKEAGTLQAGKRADVLVLNRNPLDDMHATMDIFRIVQGGNLIDREGLAGKRQEVVPRPGLVAEGFANPALKVPFIDEIWPELISTRDKPSPVTIKGSNFSKSSVVLFNDQIVRGTVAGRQRAPDHHPVWTGEGSRCLPACRCATGLGRRCLEHVLFHGDDEVAVQVDSSSTSASRIFTSVRRWSSDSRDSGRDPPVICLSSCARSRAPAGVSCSTFTRRSSAEGWRRTRPRDSRRSTSPVTFDASHDSVSASRLMGSGRPGSIRCSTWHWTGERARPVRRPQRRQVSALREEELHSSCQARQAS